MSGEGDLGQGASEGEVPMMRRFRVPVVEVRHYNSYYYVEAHSPAEAVEKAERGETFDEQPSGDYDVSERFAQDDPQELPPPAESVQYEVTLRVTTELPDPSKWRWDSILDACASNVEVVRSDRTGSSDHPDDREGEP